MMIDKIGGINPNQITKKTGVKSVDSLAPSQSINDYKVNISAEANQAKLKAEGDKLAELLKSQKDPEREELVHNVKEKVDRNQYNQLSNEQLDKIAESLRSRLLNN